MSETPVDAGRQHEVGASSAEEFASVRSSQPDASDLRCSEDGSRCLSRAQVRAISRRVIAQRQRAIAVLAAYDDQ